MPGGKGGIISDVFEELGETAKQTVSSAMKVPRDIAKTALGQGDNVAKKAIFGEKGTDEKGLSDKGDTFSLDPQQIQKAKLEQMKIADQQRARQRYKQIQEELYKIQIERQRQKDQGLDVYVTARPGGAETLEEKQEQFEKQRKLAEEQKKKEKKLPASARAGQGTAEIAKVVSG